MQQYEITQVLKHIVLYTRCNVLFDFSSIDTYIGMGGGLLSKLICICVAMCTLQYIVK